VESGFVINLGDRIVYFDINHFHEHIRDLDFVQGKHLYLLTSHQHMDHKSADGVILADLADDREMTFMVSEGVKRSLEADPFVLRKSKYKQEDQKTGTVVEDEEGFHRFRLVHTRPEKYTNNYVFQDKDRIFVLLSDGGWTKENIQDYKTAVEKLDDAKEAYILVTARGVARQIVEEDGERKDAEYFHGDLEKIANAVQGVIGKVSKVNVLTVHMPFEELVSVDDIEGGRELLKSVREHIKDKHLGMKFNGNKLYEVFDTMSALMTADKLDANGFSIGDRSTVDYCIITPEGKEVRITRAVSPVILTKKGMKRVEYPLIVPDEEIGRSVEIRQNVFEPWFFGKPE
jgi:hypothetical protein